MGHIENGVEGTIYVGKEVNDVDNNSVKLSGNAEAEYGREKVEKPEWRPTKDVENDHPKYKAKMENKNLIGVEEWKGDRVTR